MSERTLVFNGNYVGNGTTQSIVVGFKPSRIHVLNWTNDGSEDVLKLTGMEGDTCQVNKSTKGKILSGGITITSTGFTVGASIYVNKTGSIFLWEVA